jgi:hypothetical protein
MSYLIPYPQEVSGGGKITDVGLALLSKYRLYQTVREVDGRCYATAKYWNPAQLYRFLAIVPIIVAREISLRRAHWKQVGSPHGAVNVVRGIGLASWECSAQRIYPVMSGRHARQ